LEHVVPELGTRKRRRNQQIVLEEAVLDIELFGHPAAPDRLIDGRVRHPAAEHIISTVATSCGAAAADGVKCKEKRYPPRAGKTVILCALETWGFSESQLDALLDDLAVLAAQRQRDRGLQPTRWRLRWQTLIGVGVAMDIGKSILAAINTQFKPAPAMPVMEPVT
jgi:hypothetical protein